MDYLSFPRGNGFSTAIVLHIALALQLRPAAAYFSAVGEAGVLFGFISLASRNSDRRAFIEIGNMLHRERQGYSAGAA